MIKKFLVVSLLFLFAMQFVLADTDIILKTPEFTEIHLTVLDPDADYSAYAIYKKTSDAYGDAVFTYSGEELVFDLMVVLKKADKTISSEKYRENYVAGESVYLEIIPSGYELKETPSISGNIVDEGTNITNSTEESNETTNLDETNLTSNETLESKNRSSIFSFLKSEGDKQSKEGQSFKALYIIGAIIVLLAIAFFIFRFLRTKRTPKIKITKLSEVSSPSKSLANKDSSNFSHLIKEAEEKINQAQDEINGLKKKQQIKDIKEKLIKDKEELNRLSRG